MNKLCFINKNRLFDLTNKIVLNKRIVLDEIFHSHPIPNHPVFPNTEHLFLYHCDKNYTYYHLTKTIFPNVNTIYCLTHPCDPRVFNEFLHCKIYLSSNHSRYKTRWFDENENIVLVNHNDCVEKMNSEEKEDIKF